MVIFRKKEEVDLNINDLRDKKREMGYTDEDIAFKTGIPLEEVRQVFSGDMRIPRYDTLVAIVNLFEINEDILNDGYGENITLDDYYAAPDDIRVEIIDGVIYYMATPVLTHQSVIAGLFREFNKCDDKMRKKGCKLFLSPTGVRLNRDSRTIVVPDLLILCRKLENLKWIEGAPDFVVEVLSPSTRRMDMTIKLRKYMEAGVREYWIIDYNKNRITVYDFSKGPDGKDYTFEDKIPVAISNGDCEIDMKNVKEYVLESVDMMTE